MRRFTKWLVAVAVVAGVGFAAQAASAAGPIQIQPTFPHHHHHHPYPNPGPFPPQPFPFPPPRIDFDYVVLYKPSIFTGWRVYGKYETLHQARHAAQRLDWRGVDVRIERIRDYNGGYGW